MVTVARWMTELLPRGMDTYMVKGGKLFRLKRIRCYNGSVRPVLECLKGRLAGEFTGEGGYTLESPVFLSAGEDLVGVAVTDIANSVEVAGTNCWALRSAPGETPQSVIGTPEKVTVNRGEQIGGLWCG